jgi:hypothetical protein
MLGTATKTAVLSLVAAIAAPSQAQAGDNAPTSAELQELIGSSWTNFAALIRRQDGLNVIPSRFTGLRQALCRSEQEGTYECVSLVEYELPTGIRRSSLLRHNVGRDAQGRLSDVIIIREMPGSP